MYTMGYVLRKEAMADFKEFIKLSENQELIEQAKQEIERLRTY